MGSVAKLVKIQMDHMLAAVWKVIVFSQTKSLAKLKGVSKNSLLGNLQHSPMWV